MDMLKTSTLTFPNALSTTIFDFLVKNKKLSGSFSDLGNKEELFSNSADWDELITTVKNKINDRDLGIAVIDIPEPKININIKERIWFGAFLALFLIRNIFTPKVDKNTKLDFSIYNASSRGAKLLEEKGIKYFSPEKHLGFHTDGTILDDCIFSPRTVGIYNMFLGYKNPGDFYWIPFSKWERFHDFIELASGKSFQLEITPITYKDRNGNLIIDQQGIYDIPLVAKCSNMNIPYFNGEIIGCKNNPLEKERVIEIIKTLGGEGEAFKIQQKERRLIILNNWFGAHARDVFQEPWIQTGYTRSFFRAMDEVTLRFQ